MDNLSSGGLIAVAAGIVSVISAAAALIVNWRTGHASLTEVNANVSRELIEPLRQSLAEARSESAALRDQLRVTMAEAEQFQRELTEMRTHTIPQLNRRIDRLVAENERLQQLVRAFTQGEA